MLLEQLRSFTTGVLERNDQAKGTHLLSTGSHTSIWRVTEPLPTVLCAKVGTALQGMLLRLKPLKGLATTGAVGQDTMEAVRAAIALGLGNGVDYRCWGCEKVKVRAPKRGRISEDANSIQVQAGTVVIDPARTLPHQCTRGWLQLPAPS